MKFNNLTTCIILMLTFLLTSSCKNLFRWTDANEVPVNANERVQKNLEEGREYNLELEKIEVQVVLLILLLQMNYGELLLKY